MQMYIKTDLASTIQETLLYKLIYIFAKCIQIKVSVEMYADIRGVSFLCPQIEDDEDEFMGTIEGVCFAESV